MKGKDINSLGYTDPCHHPLLTTLPKNTLVGPHEVDLLGSGQGATWPSWLALVSPMRISEMTLNRTGAEKRKQREKSVYLLSF